MKNYVSIQIHGFFATLLVFAVNYKKEITTKIVTIKASGKKSKGHKFDSIDKLYTQSRYFRLEVLNVILFYIY